MKDRVERLRSRLAPEEAIYISSYPNLFYFSGFMSEDAVVVISREKAMLFTDSRYTIQARQQAPDFEIQDIEKLVSALEQLPQGQVGYEEGHMTVRRFNQLCRQLEQKELVPRQKLISSFRQEKDAGEIEKLRAAEAIGDAAFSYIADRIRPGRTEREIALELEFFMKQQGASGLSFDTIAASGERSAMPHGVASDKVLENGDFFTLDFGCVFEGYCSDMTRTVVLGQPTEKQKEIYELVLQAQKAALNAIAVGEKCSAVDQVARDIIRQGGYGECFGHALGHSVGIEIHEAPNLSPKCDTVIMPGHIFTVEPGIYVEGLGGVRIEDMVAVRQQGIENLTSSPKELIQIN